MAAANSYASMTGFFKEIYGDDVKSLAPFKAKLMKKFEFSEAKAIGNKYHQPVRLTGEHGFTYSAAQTSPVTLLSPSSGQLGDAQVDGSQLFGRAQIDYETMFRAYTDNDKKAFGNSTKEIVKALAEGGIKRIEAQILRGQQGIGIVASQTGGSGATRAVVLTAAEWSPGMWANEEGASLDLWAAALTGSKLNTNAAIVIVSVDPATRTLNLSGNATDLDAAVAGTVFFWETASPTTEFAGLNKILSNAGTLFNISAATYSLWKGNTYAVGSVAPTMRKVLAGLAKCASYGLDEDVLCIVSPSQFEDLNEDLAALRMFDSSYAKSKAESGFESIVYYGQTGKVEIMAHQLQFDGYMHVVPPSQLFRIGATDLTFIKRGGGKNEELIIDSATTGVAEMRCYSHQALFMQRPRWGCYYTGVTP